MAYTTVITHATGDVLPASDWNTYIRDNLTYLHGGGGATIDVSAGAQILKPYAISTGPAAQGIGMAAGAFMGSGGVNPYAASVAAAASTVFLSTVVGDATDWRFLLQADGRMWWGPGSGGRDTTLYRLSSNNLQTDGSFWAGISLVLAATAAGTLYFSAALDTYMTRNAAGLVGLNAKLFEGNPALTTVTVPATFTPNLATGLIQRVNVSAGGASTLTIGAPTNSPVSSQTSLLVVQIANNGGGTITIAWNAAFVGGSTLALPASSATGTTRDVLFVWDGANWRILSIG